MPLYPHRLSICWNLFTVCSFPVMQQRGTSRKPTAGLGFTVKYRKSETTSLSLRRPDCAAPTANSSTDISGNRTSDNALPRTERLFSGVAGNCCLLHSASDHLHRNNKLLHSLMFKILRITHRSGLFFQLCINFLCDNSVLQSASLEKKRDNLHYC